MLAGAYAAYEVRRIFTVSTSVRIRSWRCEQECRQDACESRHAYPGEHQTSPRSLFLVENLTMKKGIGLPYANWLEVEVTFLMSQRQDKTSRHGV